MSLKLLEGMFIVYTTFTFSVLVDYYDYAKGENI